MERAVAILKREMPSYTWVGIYLLEGDELVLGPFVGKPSPHTRIPLGRGICGAAASEKATIIVDDVNADPRYLACSLETRSEIVVPIMLAATCSARSTSTAIGRRRSARPTATLLEAVAALLAPALRTPALRPASPTDMTHVITLIPGDGIGPEVTEAVSGSSRSAGLDIEWERHDAGVTAFKRFNQSLPVALLDSIRRNKVALKGPVTTPIAEGFTSVNVGLRKALDLYANLRPVKNLPGVPSRFQDVDLVIVRENTEDLYAGPRARGRARAWSRA